MTDDRTDTCLAGAAEIDITPAGSVFLYGYPHVERMSTGVHDSLLASAMALSDGRTTVLFVANDVIWVPKPVCRAASRRIAEATGVPPRHVLITATHTHSGPVTTRMASNLHDSLVPEPDPAYLRQLENAIVRAAIGAYQNLRPATLHFATADGSGLGTNRRSPDGPAIPTVPTLIAYPRNDDRHDHTPIAVMCVCAMHPTVLHADSTVISGDFPGLARRLLQTENLLGSNCPFIYHMGASGNQSPRHVTRANTLAEADRLGGLLAQAITEAIRAAQPLDRPAIDVASTDLSTLPLRPLPAPDEAEIQLHVAAKKLEQLQRSGAPRTQVRTAEVDWFGAQETLTLAKLAAEGRLPEYAAACLPAEVRVFRIGPYAWVGWPGEVFVEFALDVMRRHNNTFVVTLAGGDLQGYLVTQEALDDHAYEAGNALFKSPDAGRMLVEATDDLLNHLNEHAAADEPCRTS